jgi:hypothetical protein
MYQGSVFDCSVLPACELTCAGPSRPLTRTWSRHCACGVEWATHASNLSSLLTLATYIALNLARWV